MTDEVFQKKLQYIKATPAFLNSLSLQSRGIEKESLRTDQYFHLAQSAHPKSLGSALCHPQITNDFSEAQIEMITPVHDRIDTCLYDLHKVHQFTYQQIAQQHETLWPSSMPCPLEGETKIPIAHFGNSNVAKMKTTYRNGLGHRYNRAMQTISGIHYNFSLNQNFFVHLQKSLNDSQPHSEFKTQQYFNLIRNFHRYSPIFVYLFGASPAFDESFIQDMKISQNRFRRYNKTLYLPKSTSLRLSDIGYTSQAQESIHIDYNDLNNYTESLREAIKTPFDAYTKIGLKHQHDYKQLNTALLQIENEFYGPIRPKRVCASGEAPINALNRGGVQYVEVRCVDVDPFKMMGVDSETILFLDMLLIYCLIKESPLFSETDLQVNHENLQQVISSGREPDLYIQNPTTFKNESFQNWALNTLKEIQQLAEMLDGLQAETPYQNNIKQQTAKIHNSQLTPSAKVLEAIMGHGDFTDFVSSQAQTWQQYFLQRPLSQNSEASFRLAVENSLAQQNTIEATDNMSFTEYLHHYFEQY